MIFFFNFHHDFRTAPPMHEDKLLRSQFNVQCPGSCGSANDRSHSICTTIKVASAVLLNTNWLNLRNKSY